MHYRLLGKSGLRVSELCLGTMTFGTEWGWGADQATSKAIFDAFAEAGGTFLDTANRYTFGTSEKFIGEFVATDRDHFVLGTKYSLRDRDHDLNFAGNHRKNLLRSVRESLKRLNTEYLDLLWVHAWDGTTPEEELMRALEDLVRSGQVLHLGMSNAPAWLIARSNTIAELRGWSAFVALQIEYSLAQRTPERDLIPMAQHLGLSTMGWAPLGGGVLTGKYLAGGSGRLWENNPRRNARNESLAQVVSEAASALGVSGSQVALAWIREQPGGVIPILGVRSPEQLRDNLGCLAVTLPEEWKKKLDAASAIDLGFPHDVLQSAGTRTDLFANQFDLLR